MCADELDPTQESEEVASQSTSPAPESTDKSSGGWARRKFLTAAALGTAAAAFLKSGGSAGPSVGVMRAYADDLSGLNCTANDVRIVGPGIILNEPCPCTGTFNALVRFRVINNTGTTRYCVTVHFCPGSNGFSPGDILIGDVPAKSDAFYTVSIPNYPCGSGLVCFGACGSGTDPITGQPDCSFAKGEDCPAGQCCTTISWDVNPGCPTRVISSKCRHQQVCILGRGAASLQGATVTCGSNATLTLCTTSGASFGPFSFSLSTADGTVTITPGAVSADGKCRTFTAGPITATTSFTGTVTDGTGCASSAQANVTTTAIAVPQLSGALDAGCVGSATFTVANCNANITYTYQEVDCVTGASIGSAQSGLGKCSAAFTFAPGNVDATHCVKVTASNGAAACDQTAQASVTVPAAVTATLAVSGTPGCDGVVTLLATAGGGVAPYSFQFNGATGVVSGSGNTRTIVIQPQLNGVARSVTVTVTDSRQCSATSSPVAFSQCVTTTFS